VRGDDAALGDRGERLDPAQRRDPDRSPVRTMTMRWRGATYTYWPRWPDA